MALAPFLFFLLLPGCQSAGYYWQVTTGHMALMHKRELIVDVLKKNTLSAADRHKFTVVKNARQFARKVLKLDVAKHYITYIPTDDSNIVWSVYATPRLAMKPLKWCYWWVGCAHYRGFFDAKDAGDFQDTLLDQGYDTSVVGAMAYSTLGYFSDSILSSFLRLSDAELAGLLFHELSHATVYIKGDTTLNESFAMVVEEEGLRQWLHQFGRDDLMQKVQKRKSQRNKVIAMILQAKAKLLQIYQSSNSDDEKLHLKSEVFRQLKQHYWEARQHVSYSGFDRWMKQPLNNAVLLTIATYNDWMPELTQLFANVGRDFRRFYESVRNLGKLEKKERIEVLKSLM